MNVRTITEKIREIFDVEKVRIVFWHDPEAEFAETVSELALDTVTILNINQIGFLELKIRLEIENLTGKFLLYCPSPEPTYENDGLLDIRLYSRTFRADRASLLLNELGLVHQTLRGHLSNRKAFFKNIERTQKLKKLVQPSDLEDDLDWKMLAVLTKAPQPNSFSVLMSIFSHRGTETQRKDNDEKAIKNEPLSSVPPCLRGDFWLWQEVQKFGLDTVFFKGLASTFGFSPAEGSQNPLHDLLIRVLVTDFSGHLRGGPPGVRHPGASGPLPTSCGSETPKGLQHLVLPEKTNCSVFVSQWQRDIHHFASFQSLSHAIGKELKLTDLVSKMDELTLEDVFTFEGIERRILSVLRDSLLGPLPHDPEPFRTLIRHRRDGIWTQMKLDAETDENPYSLAYEALETAIDLFLLKEKHVQGFSFPEAKEFYSAYTQELFRFDQLYRLFLASADQMELFGWDILKPLREAISACYEGWYLDQISASWGKLLEQSHERNLFQSWKLEGIHSQQDFFDDFVHPILSKNPKARAFVIISDALRYEAGEELTNKLNQKSRVKATLSSMLGVLPGYTALGMASLLPHKKIAYAGQNGEIQLDGMPCGSFQDRSKILEAHDGIAFKADELLEMSKEDGREAVKGFRLVYIYHDRIDSTGDKASTEKQTLKAVQTALEELTSLVRIIINNLNGSNVFITSDHGFLFQEHPLSTTDKSELSKKPDGAFLTKKRYIVGNNLKTSSKAWNGFTRDTAGTDDETEFWIPKGNNRFHFVGGAQFVHGGAMLQEIVIPLITVKELEGKQLEKATVRKVGISLLGSSRRVVNNVQKFEFIQTEQVTDRHQPLSVTVSLRDGETLISNEVTLTFNSTSESMEERKRVAKIILKKGSYDKKKEYHLIVRDAETQIEVESIGVTIDLAIMNDF